MCSIEIRKISITDLEVDAIVNAANDGLWAGGVSSTSENVLDFAKHKRQE
jgi:O-acetyl-ADP-ribose deacetylase (regulator of RNase III)